MLFASDPGPTICFDLARVLMEIGLVSAEDDFSSTVLRSSRSGDYTNTILISTAPFKWMTEGY